MHNVVLCHRINTELLDEVRAPGDTGRVLIPRS